MSSKQINFFMSESNLNEIYSFLIEKNSRIIPRRTSNPDNYSDYNFAENPESIFQFCLFNKDLPRGVFYEKIESKNEYFIDTLRSACIEFSIGGFYPYSSKDFHSSRFYYVFKYFNNGVEVMKGDKFIEWGDDLIKSFKKVFLLKKESGIFQTQKFAEWVQINKPKMSVDGTKFILP